MATPDLNLSTDGLSFSGQSGGKGLRTSCEGDRYSSLCLLIERLRCGALYQALLERDYAYKHWLVGAYGA